MLALNLEKEISVSLICFHLMLETSKMTRNQTYLNLFLNFTQQEMSIVTLYWLSVDDVTSPTDRIGYLE